MTTPPKYEDLVLKVAELERSEAALREELRLAKSLQTTTDAIVMMVDAQRDHWIEKCGSLKQRLTVAEQLLSRALQYGGMTPDWRDSVEEALKTDAGSRCN